MKHRRHARLDEHSDQPSPKSGPNRPHAVRRRSRVAAAAVLVAAVVLAALNLGASPASADPLPLSPVPTADLSCDNGTSNLTIHWPAGEYGSWLLNGGYLGDLSGPGGVFAAPTDEVHVVPSGWSPIGSTFRLNRDPGSNISYNESHVTVSGTACPFQTNVTLSMDCASRTLSIAVPAGSVSYYGVFDDSTGAPIDERVYPGFDWNSFTPIPMPEGPATLTAAIPPGVTVVRAELTINGAQFTRSLTLNCSGGCVYPLAVWSSAQRAPLNHWPVTSVTAGNATFTAAQAQVELARYSTPNYLLRMEQQLIVAKLNQARGASSPTLTALIAEGDAFLQAHPVGSTLTVPIRNSSESIRNRLLAFNGGGNELPSCGCGPL